ncbi:alpha-1,4-glucan--maltose-1-phosphate maltosyltransferase [Auritidibacter ignavus]|uniref:alpha-1,4-glucan--maltose-1-phosphate maltosyltransferase n=1 Tax=Auritidibacter ignavus TaxID=678932 RepID=UPI000F03439E|nr:alpha-1,4-glucan--maltose-1-phosphate maltosyltransferase [Auritidibacter ignavus]NIH71916.1 starch synthase (maltosyl-transferring) [Auritidibacter ignavus]RMX22656.1 alpha-1,4-glucan--maltose-1-phosphate maltosyltransferase [Auritidibacter ignavus]
MIPHQVNPTAESVIPSVTRIPVTDVSPVVDQGRYPATAVLGEDIPVSATVFREGHDSLGVTVVLLDPEGNEVQRVRMHPGAPGTDRWHARIRPSALGRHTFAIESYADDFLTWYRAAVIKVDAGVDVQLMLDEGVHLFERVQRSRAERQKFTPQACELFADAVTVLRDSSLSPPQRLEQINTAELQQVLEDQPLRSFVGTTGGYPLDVQRPAAGQGSWYEFFPRSEGAYIDEDTGLWVSGSFATAEKRLAEVAEMGFTVVYLPPIHPIGTTHRKGPNNTLTAGEHDPGSPWAIGSPQGGHDAIHPDLGKKKDFKRFVKTAHKHQLEIALDLALQCSPDHPWVEEHPEWFTTRLDGTIAYAENPPKKYQDIYPLNFDHDPQGLAEEIHRVVLHWIKLGVKIFRVDNPHTKPLWFWEWLIATVRKDHPETVFLAEAFTRPAMMHALGKIGFQQSYGYFTWRNSRDEIAGYLHEISHDTPAFYRPNFFVNTPDILTEFLQSGLRSAFAIRATLAATASPLWGVYSGFELFEHVPRPGAEEYIDNEKYQYRPRDFRGAEAAGNSLAPYLRHLNAIRATHPALGQLQNLQLHSADTPNILVYSKVRNATPAGIHRDRDLVTDSLGPEHSDSIDRVIVVLTTDPEHVQEATITLDRAALELPATGEFQVKDLITDAVWTWSDQNYIRLDPGIHVAHILTVLSPEEEQS